MRMTLRLSPGPLADEKRSWLASWLHPLDNARREPRWQHYCQLGYDAPLLSDHSHSRVKRCQAREDNKLKTAQTQPTLPGWDISWTQVSSLVTPELSVVRRRFLGWGDVREGCQGQSWSASSRWEGREGEGNYSRQTIGMLRLITIITLRATAITTLPLLAQTHFTFSPPALTVRHELLTASEVLCWRFLLPTMIIILLSKYLPIIQIFYNKLYSFTIPAL